MITFIEGTVVEKHATSVVLNVGGVGYEVFIPLSSYDKLPKESAMCKLLTHDYVREEQHSLFGFITSEERSTFRLLLGVTGIGPKIALGALSGLTVRELRAAIVSGDVKRLSSISGVGKRTAERMVVELKDKIDASDALEALAGTTSGQEDTNAHDALLALEALGYKHEKARAMVERVLKQSKDAVLGVEDIIRKALAG